MRIVIAYDKGEPIYEQMKNQIRAQILSGAAKEGEMLPSIRTVAKELRIGVITAKRAYDDLCAEGFLYSVPGKGVFVAPDKGGLADEYAAAALREKFKDIALFASENSVGREIVDKIYKEFFGK